MSGSGELACPECGEVAWTGEFPVSEGTLAACEPCALDLVVAIEDYGDEDENVAHLVLA